MTTQLYTPPTGLLPYDMALAALDAGFMITACGTQVALTSHTIKDTVVYKDSGTTTVAFLAGKDASGQIELPTGAVAIGKIVRVGTNVFCGLDANQSTEELFQKAKDIAAKIQKVDGSTVMHRHVMMLVWYSSTVSKPLDSIRDIEMVVPGEVVIADSISVNGMKLEHVDKFLKSDSFPHATFSKLVDKAKLARAPSGVVGIYDTDAKTLTTYDYGSSQLIDTKQFPDEVAYVAVAIVTDGKIDMDKATVLLNGPDGKITSKVGVTLKDIGVDGEITDLWNFSQDEVDEHVLEANPAK